MPREGLRGPEGDVMHVIEINDKRPPPISEAPEQVPCSLCGDAHPFTRLRHGRCKWCDLVGPMVQHVARAISSLARTEAERGMWMRRAASWLLVGAEPVDGGEAA